MSKSTVSSMDNDSPAPKVAATSDFREAVPDHKLADVTNPGADDAPSDASPAGDAVSTPDTDKDARHAGSDHGEETGEADLPAETGADTAAPPPDEEVDLQNPGEPDNRDESFQGEAETAPAETVTDLTSGGNVGEKNGENAAGDASDDIGEPGGTAQRTEPDEEPDATEAAPPAQAAPDENDSEPELADNQEPDGPLPAAQEETEAVEPEEQPGSDVAATASPPVPPGEEERADEVAGAEVIGDTQPDEEKEKEEEDEEEAIVTGTASDIFALSPENLGAAAGAEAPRGEAAVLTESVHQLAARLESIQESLNTLNQQLSERIAALSSDTESILKQVNDMTHANEVSAELSEHTVTVTKAKNILSVTFMVVSSLAIAALIGFQVYIFLNHVKSQQSQKDALTALAQNLTNLDRNMAAYNRNLVKAMEKPDHMAAAQPAVATGVKTAPEAPRSPVSGPALPEKLNKLRNGLQMVKLTRNHSGDWFAANRKSNDYITDTEVLQALERAYEKQYGTRWPDVPREISMVLKPNGIGGTEIVTGSGEIPAPPASATPKKEAHKRQRPAS